MPRPDLAGGRRRAVVTGCAGFIGSALAEALVAEGWGVTGVDCFTPTYPRSEKEANLAGLAREPAFDLVERDVAEGGLRPLLRGRPVVFHLAGEPGVRRSFGAGFADCMRNNVQALHRVLEDARAAGAARVVWASSSSVYGETGGRPVAEDAPTAPASPYGVAKRACEDLARAARARGLECVGLRYFTVYGPRQRPDMAVRRMCDAIWGGPAFPLLGDGSQRRDLTHVSDAVEATVRAAGAERPAPIYNVAGGEPATVAAMIAALERLAGRPMPLVRLPAAAGDVSATAAALALARRDLGYAPRTALADGLRGQLASRGRAAAPPLAVG